MGPVKGKGAVKKDKKEALKPVEDKVGKRKAVSKAPKSNKKQAPKAKPAKKDPNKPKRPPSAFFVFLEEFRKSYKLEHPNNKAVSAVGKAGGEKWQSLSRAESVKEESDKSKSDVSGGEDDEGSEEDDNDEDGSDEDDE